jgi:hypothetical protein
MQAAVYQPEDICWQLAGLLGFPLDVLDDGLPILAYQGCVLLDELLLGSRNHGAFALHGYSYPLNLIQILLP